VKHLSRIILFVVVMLVASIGTFSTSNAQGFTPSPPQIGAVGQVIVNGCGSKASRINLSVSGVNTSRTTQVAIWAVRAGTAQTEAAMSAVSGGTNLANIQWARTFSQTAQNGSFTFGLLPEANIQQWYINRLPLAFPMTTALDFYVDFVDRTAIQAFDFGIIPAGTVIGTRWTVTGYQCEVTPLGGITGTTSNLVTSTYGTDHYSSFPFKR
jgi:hypothetical protein